MGTYSLQQQVFSLALVSNAASRHSGTVVPLEAVLTQAVESFFANAQAYIGTWAIVWGPVVTLDPTQNEAGNAMFVARGADAVGKPVYVVAVAGTNPLSPYDVATEDFDVTLQPWPHPLPAGAAAANVSQGTLDGLQDLLQMTDPATGTSLQAYLEGVQGSSSATLVFTGHSLGGALAPALALALFGGPAGGTLDASGWEAVRILPIAGPTVGDAGYSALWASTFPPATDGSGNTWNQLVWNTLDVVPLAWAQLGGLSTLYSGIKWTACLGKIQAAMQQHAAAAGGTFEQPQNQALPGTFAPWASDPPLIAADVTYFLVEMLHQHVWAYFDLLEVTGIRPLLMPAGDPLQNAAPSDVTWLARGLVATHCVLPQPHASGSQPEPAR